MTLRVEHAEIYYVEMGSTTRLTTFPVGVRWRTLHEPDQSSPFTFRSFNLVLPTPLISLKHGFAGMTGSDGKYNI